MRETEGSRSSKILKEIQLIWGNIPLFTWFIMVLYIPGGCLVFLASTVWFLVKTMHDPQFCLTFVLIDWNQSHWCFELDLGKVFRWMECFVYKDRQDAEEILFQEQMLYCISTPSKFDMDTKYDCLEKDGQR